MRGAEKGVLGGWDQRFLVLKDGNLYWYKDERDVTVPFPLAPPRLRESSRALSAAARASVFTFLALVPLLSLLRIAFLLLSYYLPCPFSFFAQLNKKCISACVLEF
jgi:hypothetical protein